jgi:GAF domain-containing protein
MLMDAAGDLQLIASTSEEAQLVELLQLAAGEGPCLDCFRTGSAVTVADLDVEGGKWPEFQASALGEGFHSVHATPLRLRGQVIGTMNLFSKHAGALTPPDVAVAQALADVATIGILQERNIRSGSVLAEQLQQALDSRILIEQAKGVLAASAGLSMTEAFTTLRAYSRSNNLSLRSVSAGVVDRSITIDQLTGKPAATR